MIARSKRKHERGVTLLEVMIAAAVFTVGALGLLQLMYGSLGGTGTSRKLTEATLLAQTKLDELLSFQFTAAALNAGTVSEGASNIGAAGTPYAADGTAAGAFGDPDGGYARSWVITDLDLNADVVGADYKQITVYVRWTDGTSGAAHEVALQGGKSSQ